VVSGMCTLAFFRVQGRLWCTPLGTQTGRAAAIAGTAAVGGIVISPEAGGHEDRARARGDSDTPDFEDSELDLSSLGWPAADGIDIH
jgi:hypothetical protein